MHHQQEADTRHRCDRNACDTGGHGWIDHRQPDKSGQEGQPEQGDVAVADMPAIKIEIGEEKDEQGRCEDGFRRGAINPLSRLIDGETRWKKPKSMPA